MFKSNISGSLQRMVCLETHGDGQAATFELAGETDLLGVQLCVGNCTCPPPPSTPN